MMSQLAAQGIAPKDVGREIDRIRREAADQFNVDREADKAASTMRATLSNLIIVVCEPCATNTTTRINEVIDTLAVQHPSRFFIVRCNRNGQSELGAEVRSRCVQARSGNGICTEEVYLHVSPETADVVPNLLLSLLVPDIETVLLLLNDTHDLAGQGFTDLVPTLAGMSEVVMYDSAAFYDYRRGVDAILGLLAQEPRTGFEGAIARDVSWLRVKRWQELLIEQFNAQQFVSMPGAIQRIQLTQYAPQAGVKKPSAKKGAAVPLEAAVYPESVLLLAWCFDCLQWTVQGLVDAAGGSFRIACRDRDGASCEVWIENLSGAEASSGDRIQAVTTWAAAGSGQMQVSIARDRQGASAKVSVSVTADGSGDLQSCDYSARRTPFVTPRYSEIVSSRIGTQRIHTQRERCVQIARELAAIVSPNP